MEIIVKVGISDKAGFCSQDFSESLLSSILSALLELEDKKTKLQNLLPKMIALGEDVEEVSFITRRLGEACNAYSDLSQLYYFLSHKDGYEINLERTGN